MEEYTTCLPANALRLNYKLLVDRGKGIYCKLVFQILLKCITLSSFVKVLRFLLILSWIISMIGQKLMVQPIKQTFYGPVLQALKDRKTES